MTLNLKIRVALLALRLSLVCLFLLGLLLGFGTAMQPWVMAGVILFIGALGTSLFLLLEERRNANG